MVFKLAILFGIEQPGDAKGLILAYLKGGVDSALKYSSDGACLYLTVHLKVDAVLFRDGRNKVQPQTKLNGGWTAYSHASRYRHRNLTALENSRTSAGCDDIRFGQRTGKIDFSQTINRTRNLVVTEQSWQVSLWTEIICSVGIVSQPDYSDAAVLARLGIKAHRSTAVLSTSATVTLSTICFSFSDC